MPVKFRSSSVGNLLVGGSAITDKQKETLAALEARRDDPEQKDLTAKQTETLNGLLEKRNQPFKFGATALSYIKECWLRDTYGFEECVSSPAIQKGHLCEDEGIGIATRHLEDGGFRCKNERSFEDDWLTGTPDIITDTHIEDIKCSFTLKTFSDIDSKTYNPIYHCQLQAYMSLVGRDKARLIYTLCPTPYELVQEEIKRHWFAHNCDDANEHYLEAERKITASNAAVDLIPESQRIKVFEFDRNDMFIEKLRKRIEQARDIYDNLTL